MKTLPSLYLSSVAVPTRPWWKQSENTYLRTDGRTASTAKQAEQIDQIDPLPRPEFQIGQVWLILYGDSSRTYTLLGRLEVKGAHGTPIRYWNVAGPYVPAQVSDDQLQEYLVDAYLLHDPIGQKAPWAPWKLA